jgi:hypothetical protein
MTSRILGFLIAVLLCGLSACGSDDDTNPNAQLCEDVRAKLQECNKPVSSGQCREDVSEAVLCAARCTVAAECAQINAPATDNPYYRCVAECSGAPPDAFICADGSVFVAAQGVCDGTPQCPDGSDEANCPSM